jgi:hypothetical protein
MIQLNFLVENKEKIIQKLSLYKSTLNFLQTVSP